MGRYEQAIGDYELTLRLDPEHAQACSNLGNALRDLGHPDKALVWYDRSLALKPDITNATNRALVLTEFGRFLEAGVAYQYAMAIDPQNPWLVSNLALFQLLLGDFDAGWRGREARWNVPGFAENHPRLDTPMWSGEEPVAGKTIAIFQNDVVGDAIQFARYVPKLVARGARIILVVNPELCPLLSNLSGVSHCLPKTRSGVVPPFDLHIAIDNLPLAFGTRLDSIPLGKDYLPPPEARLVQARTGAGSSTATTAPGIPRFVCSGRLKRENMEASSDVFVLSWKQQSCSEARIVAASSERAHFSLMSRVIARPTPARFRPPGPPMFGSPTIAC